jgi:hypothetical protein
VGRQLSSSVIAAVAYSGGYHLLTVAVITWVGFVKASWVLSALLADVGRITWGALYTEQAAEAASLCIFM